MLLCRMEPCPLVNLLTRQLSLITLQKEIMPICFATGQSIGLKLCNLCLRKGLRTFLLSFLFLLHAILLLLTT